MMSGRGDLGFIPNNRSSAPNKNFFGGTGHPSKKGVTYSQVSRLNNESSLPVGIGTEELIAKRTDWLESQEKKLTATLNETRSDAHRLHNIIDEHVSELSERIEKSKHDTISTQNAKQLFNEMQMVYGKVSTVLYGFDCNSEPYSELESYKLTPDKFDLEIKASKNEWIVLMYPMESVTCGDKVKQLMRRKSIDQVTGQLFFSWVVVYESDEVSEERSISQFSLLPQ